MTHKLIYVHISSNQQKVSLEFFLMTEFLVWNLDSQELAK